MFKILFCLLQVTAVDKKSYSYRGGSLKNRGRISFEFEKDDKVAENFQPCCIDGSGSKYANRFCACDTSHGLGASCHAPCL